MKAGISHSIILVAASLIAATPASAAIVYMASSRDIVAFDTANGTIADTFWIVPNSGPLAVAGSIRMRVAAVNGNISSEYTLDGTLLGQTTVDSFSFRGWDGTTDGVAYNYAMTNTDLTSTIYRYDRNWDNETELFTFSNGSYQSALGIAYDLSNDTVWVETHRPGNEIRNYDLAGNLISSFTFDNGLQRPGALAYDGGTDTIWFLTELSRVGNGPELQTLLQFDKNGNQLNSFLIEGMRHRYNMEFAANPSAVVPEPGALMVWSMLALASGAVTFWRRSGSQRVDHSAA